MCARRDTASTAARARAARRRAPPRVRAPRHCARAAIMRVCQRRESWQGLRRTTRTSYRVVDAGRRMGRVSTAPPATAPSTPSVTRRHFDAERKTSRSPRGYYQIAVRVNRSDLRDCSKIGNARSSARTNLVTGAKGKTRANHVGRPMRCGETCAHQRKVHLRSGIRGRRQTNAVLDAGICRLWPHLRRRVLPAGKDGEILDGDWVKSNEQGYLGRQMEEECLDGSV